MTATRFELVPANGPVPETGAIDHSATLPDDQCSMSTRAPSHQFSFGEEKEMTATRFELVPANGPVPKTGAIDHSATLPDDQWAVSTHAPSHQFSFGEKKEMTVTRADMMDHSDTQLAEIAASFKSSAR